MKEITVEPMVHRPNVRDVHVATLSTMLKIAQLDKRGERIGSRQKRKLVMSLPATLGAYRIDDFLNDEPGAIRHPAAELLLTEAIESTSLLNEEVLRTVIAGAEKFKVIRETGCAMYQTKSNALRVPLGETQINAPVVAEGTIIPDRTQDYDYRNFSILKYAMKPRISYEMIEDGLVDVVSEEIFFAGAALENRLNYDALTSLASNAGNNTTTQSLATLPYTALKQAKRLLKVDGFFADTVIMCSDLEGALLDVTALGTPYGQMTEQVMRQGQLPSPLQGMSWFVTDNGSLTVDGSNPWRYTTDLDIGGIVMEAKRGCGIAMRRDRTIKKFDDIEKELNTITATMRCDVSFLHANAVCKINCLA
jgi:hypothetical protein